MDPCRCNKKQVEGGRQRVEGRRSKVEAGKEGQKLGR